MDHHGGMDQSHLRSQPKSISASDLYVVLERAFRRRSRGCTQCNFSLPYRLPDSNGWSVEPTETCSNFCRMLLEDLVSEYRPGYRLTAPSAFRAH